jgi:hypothetical protein
MKASEYIDKVIEDQGRTKAWVASKSDINYKTFIDKLKHDRFTADELLLIGKVLNLDLNRIKEEL